MKAKLCWFLASTSQKKKKTRCEPSKGRKQLAGDGDTRKGHSEETEEKKKNAAKKKKKNGSKESKTKDSK